MGKRKISQRERKGTDTEKRQSTKKEKIEEKNKKEGNKYM